MITVNISVNGADISLEQPTLADGSKGGMTAHFHTDFKWNGLALTAVFRTSSGDVLMPLKNGKCDIPCEVTENCGEVLVGLFGTDGSRTLTSVFCTLSISPGVPTSGDTAKNYTPSLYEQFSARFAKFENFTVTAEDGEKAAVTKSENESGVNLHFTVPSGKDYVLNSDDMIQIVEDYGGGMLFYQGDGEAEDMAEIDSLFKGQVIFGCMLNFPSEEALERFKKNYLEIYGISPLVDTVANIICLVNGVPTAIYLGWEEKYVDFTLPEKEMERIKAYIDETILGGAW